MTKQEALEKIEELKKFIEQDEKSKEDRVLELFQQTTSIKIDKKKFPNSTFGLKGENFLWEYDAENSTLWCSYIFIWSVLKKEYKLNPYDIQSLIKTAVEKHFKCTGITPFQDILPTLRTVEKHFKCTGITPKDIHPCNGITPQPF